MSDLAALKERLALVQIQRDAAWAREAKLREALTQIIRMAYAHDAGTPRYSKTDLIAIANRALADDAEGK